MILSRACYLITLVVIHAGKNKKECPGMWQNENRGLKKKKPSRKGKIIIIIIIRRKEDDK